MENCACMVVQVAPTLGRAMGLWLPMFPFVFTAGALFWFTVGNASLTTMTIGLIVIIVFTIRAWLGLHVSLDIWYGVMAELLLIWALRPNIKKLLAGNERVIKFSLNGCLRQRKKHKLCQKNNSLPVGNIAV